MNNSIQQYNTDWAAVVLCAGNSSRMKTHKALLAFDSEQTFIQKIVSEYIRAKCRHIVIVANEQNCKLLSQLFNHCKVIKPFIVLNKHTELERFYSIKLGLEACSNFGKCFIHNCDNPFITKELLKNMLNQFVEDSYIVPVFNNKKGHPVLLSNKIINAIIANNENNCNFKKFLENYECIEIESFDKNILININNLNDYQLLFGDNV